MPNPIEERMKNNYEDRYRFYFPRRTYTIIRIDGKCFHSVAKNCIKPFDAALHFSFVAAGIKVSKEMQGFKMAYTQSDEISFLLTDFDSEQTEAWFGGNIQKISSVSASLFTYYFNFFWEGQTGKEVCFDTRAFIIPDRNEVINYFISRNRDCARNSISMVAQHHFSHKTLQNKNTSELQEMLFQEKGINWSECPEEQKNGTVIDRNQKNESWKFFFDDPIWNELIPKIN